MTRSVWLKADSSVGDWEARKRRITAGLEAGVDWVLVDEVDVDRVRDLGEVNVAAFSSGDVHVMDAEAADVDADATIVGKDGEGDATVDLPNDFSGSADLSALPPGQRHPRRVGTSDPRQSVRGVRRGRGRRIGVHHRHRRRLADHSLENLIARVGDDTELITGVQTAEDARTAYETLELGADGVLLDSDDPDEIRRTVEVRDEMGRETLDMQWAEVTDVEQTGSADRVCIDTGNLMEHDEGMLVGSMARGLFFVHAETAESPTSPPVPSASTPARSTPTSARPTAARSTSPSSRAATRSRSSTRTATPARPSSAALR